MSRQVYGCAKSQTLSRQEDRCSYRARRCLAKYMGALKARLCLAKKIDALIARDDVSLNIRVRWKPDSVSPRRYKNAKRNLFGGKAILVRTSWHPLKGLATMSQELRFAAKPFATHSYLLPMQGRKSATKLFAATPHLLHTLRRKSSASPRSSLRQPRNYFTTPLKRTSISKSTRGSGFCFYKSQVLFVLKIVSCFWPLPIFVFTNPPLF